MNLLVVLSTFLGLLPTTQAPIGVTAFTDIGHLPFLQPNVQTHEFTSYDRAGDNYDADYFPIYKEANGEEVIFDSYGPGCLYGLHMNIWNGDVGPVKIRFYFDGEEIPRIDMDVTEFFSPENPLGIFKEPMAHIGGGYRILYHPFFYLHRLKIALSQEPLGKEPGWDKLSWLGRYDKHPYRRNHWYEFTYHTYTENPGIESWSRPADMSAAADFWNPEDIGAPIPHFSSGAIRQYGIGLPEGGTSRITFSKPGLITKLGVPPGIDPEHFRILGWRLHSTGLRSPRWKYLWGAFSAWTSSPPTSRSLPG